MNVNRSLILCAILFVTIAVASGGERWTAAEIEALRSFSMRALEAHHADCGHVSIAVVVLGRPKRQSVGTGSGPALPASQRDDVTVAGLRLFIGKAACSGCHHGPLLTNNDFHNTGVPGRPELPKDAGLFGGVVALMNDEFSCKSRWSDRRDHCPDLRRFVARSAGRCAATTSHRGDRPRIPASRSAGSRRRRRARRSPSPGES